MSGTYSQLLLHSVFSTKGRRPWITSGVAERLYPYIGGIVRAEKGVLFDIGGLRTMCTFIFGGERMARCRTLCAR